MVSVLLLCNNFPPEIGSAAELFEELAAGLDSRGLRVSVITTFPRLYKVAGLVPSFERPSLKPLCFLYNRVRVLRLFPIAFLNNKKLLMVEHLIEPIIIFVGALSRGKHDIVIVYSPPFLLGLIGGILSRIYGSRMVLNVQDPYPETAVSLGMLSNSVLISILRGLTGVVYRMASRITVHSQTNRVLVQSYGISQSKTLVIPNWIDLKKVNVSTNKSASQKGDKTRFVVTYAGIISVAQDLETVVMAARMLEDNTSVAFLIVGEGVERQRIVDLARRLGVGNVEFRPFVPIEEYVELLRVSDACIVSLGKLELAGVVPKKLIDIMAIGRPVIASVPLNSEVATIVNGAKCGFVVEPGDYHSFARTIEKLSKDRAMVESMGQSGSRYARKHFSLENAMSSYLDIIRDLECTR